MKRLLVLLVLTAISIPAYAATTWYGVDSQLGIVAYDADTGVKTDLGGPPIYNMCLGINPVNGEMWGIAQNTLYSVNRNDGTFVNEGTLSGMGSSEACSFDLAGRFLATASRTLYEVDLTTAVATSLHSITINPDGFDILPDGRWVANDSGTIYLLQSDWTLISSWSGPANETIAADENGRVFGSNGTDLHEIDIVNETSTLLWTDQTASQLYGSEASSDTVTDPTIAKFRVTKSYADGHEADIEVTLTCNGGLPLSQNFTLDGGDTPSVTFTVTEVPGTGMDCEVTETGGAAGYEPVMSGCSWTGITGGNYACSIVNQPEPVDFSVTVDWEVSDEANPGVGSQAVVILECENGSSTSTTYDAGPGVEGPFVLADVIPPATCNAYMDNVESVVEVDESDCTDVAVKVADGEVSCTITATAFYEGIPTLSQYGMALMALLMLGVGLLGFRRFA